MVYPPISKATYTLASHASKAIALFRCFDYRVDGVDPKKALLVFDKAIAPILLYGAELWGHSTWLILLKESGT